MVQVTQTGFGQTIVISESNLRRLLADFETEGSAVIGRYGQGAVMVQPDAVHYAERAESRHHQAVALENIESDRINALDPRDGVDALAVAVGRWKRAAELAQEAQVAVQEERDREAGRIMATVVLAGSPLAHPNEGGLEYVERRMRADLY